MNKRELVTNDLISWEGSNRDLELFSPRCSTKSDSVIAEALVGLRQVCVGFYKIFQPAIILLAWSIFWVLLDPFSFLFFPSFPLSHSPSFPSFFPFFLHFSLLFLSSLSFPLFFSPFFLPFLSSFLLNRCGLN